MNKSKARREKRHQQKTERDIRRAHAQAMRQIQGPRTTAYGIGLRKRAV